MHPMHPDLLPYEYPVTHRRNSPNMSPTDCLALSQRDAARRVGVHPATLKRWRAEGTGPTYIRLESGRIRYRAEALDAWLDSRAVTPGAR